MLVGRDRELDRIVETLTAARNGASGVLVVKGDPGIGKTALLNTALDRVADALVLRVVGTEIESEIPYVGLGDLFRSVADRLTSLPTRQADALASAMALGPSATGDRFAVSTATLSLLGVLAENEQVIVAVDDAHWVDRFSLEALAFTARRLGAEGITMLFTIRDAEFPNSGLEGFPVLQVTGLDRESARSLVLRQQLAVPLGPVMVNRLIDGSRGNPLALVELPTLLKGEPLSNFAAATEPLPVGDQLNRAFSLTVAQLPERTQDALLLLAVMDAAPVDIVVAALRQGGLSIDALEPAEAAGLIVDRQGRLSFRHPLVRAVVYHRAPSTRRWAAHRLAADLLASSTALDALERRAWHVIAGGIEPDEVFIGLLQANGDQKLGQHSYAGAAHAYAQAAQLTAPGPLKSLRLLLAADATRLAGRIDEASELLGEVALTTSDPRQRVQAAFHRLRLDMWRGHGRKARDGLMVLAAEIAQVDPVSAGAMLAEVAICSLELGDFGVAEQTSLRAFQAVPPEVDGAAAVYILRSFVLIMSGRKRAGRELLQAHEPDWDHWDPMSRDLADQLILVAALCHFALDEPLGRTLMTRAVASARDSDAIGVLPFRLGHLAWIEFTAGNWNSALAMAHETLLLANETGWVALLPMALANLARIEAGLGRAEESEQHATAAAQLGETTGALTYIGYADYALGMLALGKRELVKATTYLERAAERSARIGLVDTPLLPWTAALAEIYARHGDLAAAMPLIEQLEASMEEVAQPTTAAVVARCRALLEPAKFDGWIELALDWHARSPAPFEMARTELCYGEHLRRIGRRLDARSWLERARKGFEQLGAIDWERQAASELRGTGVRNLARTPTNSAVLTPQELQVALAVADGLTNREVAAKLYLSVKTIEFHLGNVYRKIGVTRRSKLTELLARQLPTPRLPSVADSMQRKGFDLTKGTI